MREIGFGPAFALLFEVPLATVVSIAHTCSESGPLLENYCPLECFVSIRVHCFGMAPGRNKIVGKTYRMQ